jgi:alpha-beta hydrolase superfamily lysophospholipase
MGSPPTARGLYLKTAPEPTFGVFHPAADPRRDTAVLLCPPFGWEEFCSFRPRRDWAEALAKDGYPALRVDLPATGDSGGSPRDTGMLATWTAAVSDAATWLRASTDCRRVAVIGIGVGGVVACRAVAEGAAIDDLVLWAVRARGKTVLRELRAFARLNATEVDAADAIVRPTVPEPPPLPDGSLEVGGFLLSGETVAALESLDLAATPLPESAGRRVLLLERDGIEVDGDLREHFEASDAKVSIAPGPGYTRMMAHPQDAQPPRSEFAAVAAWLAQASSAAEPAPSGPGDETEMVELGRPGERIRETPIEIEQPFGQLRGVLSEPIDEPAADLTAVLLNAGALRRIGPGRMWVELARGWAARGVPTLRIDLEGIGDSDGDSSPYEDVGALYALELVDQVIAAMNALERRGLSRRFLLAGLCSGAFWSFHAALRDDRVVAAFLLNSRALYWDQALDRDRDARKIGGAFQGAGWRKVLSGGVTPARMRTIVREAITAPFRARASTAARRSRGRRTDDALVQLRESGTRLLFVFGGEEPLHEELEREGRLDELDQWPNLELELLPGNDHSFRPIRSQQYVHALLERALEREIELARTARARSASA